MSRALYHRAAFAGPERREERTTYAPGVATGHPAYPQTLRQPRDGADARRPLCWNRSPYAPGRWERSGTVRGKPAWRWTPHRMTADCGAWKAPPGTLPEPARAGFLCRGCLWAPSYRDLPGPF